MMRQAVVIRWCAAAFLSLTIFAAPATAQEFPNRPIRFIVPWAPGGVTDVIARLIAEKLSGQIKQPVIVENKPGASGVIGTEFVARSAPDGYTLVVVTASTHAMGPSVVPTKAYDPVADFAPVIQVTNAPTIMVTPPSLPANTIAEFIALAKKTPDGMNFASFGQGSSSHLAAELFMQATGIKMAHVPYKGAAPAIVDLLAGRVQVFFDSIPSSLPHVRKGALKALAVTGTQRTPAAPDIPTVSETHPGFEMTVWQGLAAPRDTPKAIVDRLYSETAKVMAMPDVQKRLIDLGADPVSRTPAEFADHIRRENEKWREVVKRANIQVSN
jgi:tripartite-type tricarboxylate transporter receptor subunit TctC